MQPPSQNTHSEWPFLSFVIGWLVLTTGVVVLLGWLLSVPVIREVLPGFTPTKPNSALALILLGLAIVLRSSPGTASAGLKRKIANGLCGANIGLMLAVVFEYITQWDLGIDAILAGFNPALNVSNRTALPTALCVILLASALILTSPSKGRATPVVLILIPALLSFSALIGFLFDIDILTHYGPYYASTAHTAIGLLLVCVALWPAGRFNAVNWFTSNKMLLGFTTALAIMILLGVGLARNAWSLAFNARWVEHTFLAINQLDETLRTMADAETGERGYLLTGEEKFLEPYHHATASIGQQLANLGQLIADNPKQQRRLDALESTIQKLLALLKTKVALMRGGQREKATNMVASGEGKRLMDEVRARCAEMIHEEEQLLSLRQSHAALDTRKTVTIFSLGILLSALILLTLYGLLRREIRQHVKLESDLRRSERNLDITLHSIGDAVMATDAQGCVTRLNPVAEQLTGWTQAEALGRKVDEIFRIIHEQTRQPAVVPVAKVLATGMIHGLANHTVLVARDGIERPIADSAAPIRDQAGTLLGVVLVFRDVTEEYRLQRELAHSLAEIKDLYDHAPCGYHSLDRNGVFLTINQTELEWLGYPREEIVGQKRFLDLITPASQEVFAQNFPQFKKRGWIKDLEFELIRKDGSHFFILLSGTAIRDAKGDFLMSRSTMVDITERRRVERERDQFFAVAPDMMCVASVDGYFKQVSAAVTSLLGLTPEEFLAKPYLEQIHPDDVEATLDAVQRQMARGEKMQAFINRYRHKDGSWRYLSWTSVPQPNGLMYGTARDVTELRAAQEALERSEEWLAVTLNSIGDGVLATDTAGLVIRLNPVAEQLTGWRQAEAQQRPVTEIFRIIDEATRQPALVPVGKVLESGQTQALPHHVLLVARDGLQRPIADSAAPIRNAHGVLLGVVLVFRDVTEERLAEQNLRQSERRLQQLNEELEQRVEERTAALLESERLGRAALDSLTAQVVILDENGLILATNAAWEAHVKADGLPSESSGTGQNFITECSRLTGLPADTSETLTEGIREVLAGNRRDFVLDCSQTVNTGRRWYMCRVTRFPEGSTARVVVALENITQIRQLQNQQYRSQRMESLGKLASGVAHDLNNALSPILLGNHMLKQQFPEQADLLDTMHSSVRRGAEMVKQLLAFARGAEGERKSVQMFYLFKEMRNFIQGSFPKNIVLDVNCAPGLPLIIGDATQIHQVLLNLCVNARDAMPKGGGLTLEAEAVSVDTSLTSILPDAKPGLHVLTRVRDTGTGIAPEILEHIFEPFFTTKPIDQGSGIGLSNVLGIVKGHGGFLRVESQVGLGTSFSVYWPADQRALEAPASSRHRPDFQGHGETILFVDDEASLRRVGRAVLSRLNFSVVVAADGAEAMVLLSEYRERIAAIITDMHMPRMDGLAFARMARQLLPQVPLIVTSGRLEAKEEEELRAVNPVACLVKPYDEEQLTEILKNIFSAPANS